MMNILLVYAHPEAQSLNGSLKNFTVKHLQDAGHQVQVSNLYAMKWKASLDGDDRTDWDSANRFSPVLDSRIALEQGTQSADIALEQEKLLWADTVILQFPLWWFSMPAILKGWVERVYAYGFAYGVGEHSDTHWGIVMAKVLWQGNGLCCWLPLAVGSLITARAVSTAR